MKIDGGNSVVIYIVSFDNPYPNYVYVKPI